MGGCLVAIHSLKNFLCHNTVPLSVKHRNLKESVYTWSHPITLQGQNNHYKLCSYGIN